MRLVSVRVVDSRGSAPEVGALEGWALHPTKWATPTGVVTRWVAEDGGSVRAEHDSGMVALLPLPAWRGTKSRRPDIEPMLRLGLKRSSHGETLLVSVPERGRGRSRRQIKVMSGDDTYSYIASGWWLSGQSNLVRTHDGCVIFRRRFPGPDLLADAATPMETTLAAALDAAGAHERVTPPLVKLF